MNVTKKKCGTCYYCKHSDENNDGLEITGLRCFLDPPVILRRGEMNQTPRWSRPPVKVEDFCSHWNDGKS